jgi:hypothetical protein
MTASRFVEEEQGTYTGRQHPHNGYYAGDFSTGSRHPGARATITSSTRPPHFGAARVSA